MVGLLVLLLLAGPSARAQAPAWQTAVVLTSAESNASVIDANGDIYVTGRFSATVSFGSTALTSAGGADIFVAKWSTASNRFVWAQRAGGPAADYAYAIAVNGPNVYVAGSYASMTADFGTTTLNNFSNRPGSDNLFVTKLTDAGNTSSFTWAQQVGDSENESATLLTVAGTSVYVGGYFSSARTSFGSTVLTSPSRYSNNVFVAKLTDAGSTSSFVWAQEINLTASGSIRELAINGSSIYLSGQFSGATCSFGSTVLTNTSPPSPSTGGTNDVYIAKLTDAGSASSFVWAQQVGGLAEEGIGSLAVSGTTVYVAGYFTSSTVSFGSIRFTPVGGENGYVAKLTDAGSTGSFVWVRQHGGRNTSALAIQGPSLYLTGNFTAPTASFDSTVLTNAGNSDVFIAKLTDAGSTGTFAWSHRAGGPNYDQSFALMLNGTSIFVAGIVIPPATFGNISITTTTGARTSFLASLTDPALLAPTRALAGSAFTLYPNPARATTTVLLPALPSTATATLTLFDALGRTVRSATVALPAAGLRHELSLSGLPAGIYALQVQAGVAAATRRLVVE